MEDSPVLELRARRAFNQEVFLLNHSDAFYAYHQIHKNFDRIGLPLSKERDRGGHSHVGLLPFLLLLQRQAMSAFWAFAGHQSFEGWVLLRPGVEAALMMGKWIDDPGLAALWRERQARFEEYRKHYQGKGLVSESLQRADDIRLVLGRINDEFVHANDRYYDRHASLAPVDNENYFLTIQYFDLDASVFRAHVLAFLHLLVVIQTSLGAAIANLLPAGATQRMGLEVLEGKFEGDVRRLAKGQPEADHVLRELGLWQLEVA